MKKILIRLDDATAERLEAIAPARSRKRAQFVRSAVLRAIWEMDERAIEASYRAQPDDAPIFFSPEVWDVRDPAQKRVRKPKRTRGSDPAYPVDAERRSRR